MSELRAGTYFRSDLVDKLLYHSPKKYYDPYDAFHMKSMDFELVKDRSEEAKIYQFRMRNLLPGEWLEI